MYTFSIRSIAYHVPNWVIPFLFLSLFSKCDQSMYIISRESKTKRYVKPRKVQLLNVSPQVRFDLLSGHCSVCPFPNPMRSIFSVIPFASILSKRRVVSKIRFGFDSISAKSNKVEFNCPFEMSKLNGQ